MQGYQSSTCKTVNGRYSLVSKRNLGPVLLTDCTHDCLSATIATKHLTQATQRRSMQQHVRFYRFGVRVGVRSIPVPHMIAFFDDIIDELYSNIRCIDVTSTSTTPAEQAFSACKFVPRHDDICRVCILIDTKSPLVVTVIATDGRGAWCSMD